MNRTLDCFEFFLLTSQFPHLVFEEQQEDETDELEEMISKYEKQKDREAQLESNEKCDWSK